MDRIYLDSSVVIDYWLCEGCELPSEMVATEPPTFEAIRKIMSKKTKRLQRVTEIRQRVLSKKNDVQLISSPFALLEVLEWYSEATFKEIAAQALSVKMVQNVGKKNLARLIKRTMDEGEREVFSQDMLDETSAATGMLMSELMVEPTYALSNALAGIEILDLEVINMSVSDVWSIYSTFAYLQMGLADIMHLLAANNFDCNYFATFDEDFLLAKDAIESVFQFKVLSTPEDILLYL